MSVISGHLWTLLPSLAHRIRPETAPEAKAWSTTLQTLDAGAERTIALSGALCEREGSHSLVVIVHGLGGALDSHYVLRAARVLDAYGFSTLRLALRGADRKGEDFYHAGLVADLHAAFASPELARYRKLFVLGYSLGGHVTLHASIEPSDARVRAVAAVCAPLHLSRGADAIDRPGAFIYRNHVLSGLKEIYAAVAARRSVPTPMARIAEVRTIRQWDTLTVVPRHGFADVEDYYTRMSAGFRLGALSLPTLLLPSRDDPMVPPSTFEDLLQDASPQLTLRWVEHGGHVGYPSSVALNGKRLPNVEEHVARWFQTVG